jgi:hypothetical protein
MDKIAEAMVAGVRLGMEMAIAQARAGSLSLRPGPGKDSSKFPYTTPLHPRAEAYIASQDEQWPNVKEWHEKQEAKPSLTEGHPEDCRCVLCLH